MSTSNSSPRQRTLPDEINGLNELKQQMDAAETVEDWSHILKEYVKAGNGMVENNILVFNLGSAHDCPNLATEYCQVAADDCYAVNDEQMYENALHYRRRQEYLWDSMPPDLFADAFLEIISRKRTTVDGIRFGEADDLRHQSDVHRVERVAERLAEHGLLTYIYTASGWLDFSEVKHLAVTSSNSHLENSNLADGGDQELIVVDSEDDIPDDGFYCPSANPEAEISCGTCLACMTKGGDSDVYFPILDQ